MQRFKILTRKTKQKRKRFIDIDKTGKYIFKTDLQNRLLVSIRWKYLVGKSEVVVLQPGIHQP